MPNASRVLALPVTLSVVAVLTSACGLFGPDQPDTVAQQYVDAVNSDDVSAAAALTDNPPAASAALQQMFDSLGTDGTFTVAESSRDGSDGEFALDAQWNLAGGKQWSYRTDGKASQPDQDWLIHWDPALIAPGLTAQETLQFTPVYPAPAQVFDRNGGALMTQQVVTLVQVDPSADTTAVAAALAPVGVTAESLQGELAGAQGKPVTAITLREADLTPLEPSLTALPGVTLAKQTRLLTVDKTLSAPTLNGVADSWQEANAAAAGWTVQAVSEDGSVRKLVGPEPQRTDDINTTLDPTLQRSAEAALAPIAQPAAIVALQPSTGNVLAIAQNDSADRQGPIALTGLYPPGSTFKTVTAAAALENGTVNPDTVLPCPGTANIEGRQIPNDESFDLGAVPFHTAFARSCNTTLARLAVGLDPDALTNTAAQLGLGIDYVTPGLTTVTGAVPRADTPAARVEAGIGQGQVTASPFGMALVAASIAHGSAPAPTMIAGAPGVADRTPPTLPAGVADQLRTMMRETVSAGTATVLNDVPGLIGKTGTAEFGDNTHAHGWFVGIQDDLAFAVFVSDAGSSAPALAAAGSFLRAPR
ncbi:penicillin-binding transpeptidase domain-containing protein [Aldersonia sp. NBC_00410]|uniref:penicillin-binding transpeptidase domain-containing protein n=1 Tax=Aldersonia sp. NBC_00410 TaxID=2975954 RepID=UPI0022580695|nr:penicillin-binding transpeptidase domain-containing protein [Aldersonia sp. NBC_00410]